MLQAHKAITAQLVLLEYKDHKDYKAIKDLQVLKEITEPLVLLDRLV